MGGWGALDEERMSLRKSVFLSWLIISSVWGGGFYFLVWLGFKTDKSVRLESGERYEQGCLVYCDFGVFAAEVKKYVCFLLKL